MTQLIGNPRGLPVLKAAPTLQALALIDASPYGSNGNAGWTSTNIFLRQIRNLVIDGTAVAPTKGTNAVGRCTRASANRCDGNRRSGND